MSNPSILATITLPCGCILAAEHVAEGPIEPVDSLRFLRDGFKSLELWAELQVPKHGCTGALKDSK